MLLCKPVGLLCMVAAMMMAYASTSSHAQDVGALVAQSDAFFQQVGSGQVPPAQLLTDWTAEQERLAQVATALKDQPLALVNAKIARRQGVAALMLSNGKGSQAADGYFAQAEEMLDTLGKKGAVPQDQENRATIWKERADNLVLLGQADKARFYLDKALKAARSSSLRDKLGEATIRERLAGIDFRAEHWKEALDCLGPCVAIMTTEAERNPGFDKNALRMPLWYTAICNSRLGKDAEPDFDRYLRHVGRDITPHDEADVYREKYVNVSQRAPKQAGPARVAALRKANSYIKKSSEIIATSDKDEDTLEKVAIYTDLGVSYALGGMREESEQAFKEALRIGRASPMVGADSPVLIPTLQRYAVLLKDLGRQSESQAQTDEVSRIEKLHSK